ncbi:hypothetical protein TH61_15700 [Rufibacter sp. DG15C]|uniref:hypothetical protein n=1 Tax=Rufibacter sp. DG15C TaxID=1379909 RepID=UPI00078DD07C|nr:hypothetical protein [Rufibacter sp. DG15C]AMM52343.1 hypothetical protein TH61_15700 [Rufibacter sp. DG15C]
MPDSTQSIQKFSELAAVILDKLTAADMEASFQFEDISVQGPGAQGTPSTWRLNGRLTIKTSSSRAEHS